MISSLTQTHMMRPRVTRVRAKKEEEKKDINPIKKFIMKVFKMKEIDYDKFRKENKWAIRPVEKKDKE